jgi:hypothetical protein
MRCFQANLSYLAVVMNSQPTRKPFGFPGPTIMSSPLPVTAEDPDKAAKQLSNLYAKLVILFDGWKGKHASIAQQTPTHLRQNRSVASMAHNMAFPPGAQVNQATQFQAQQLQPGP